MRSSLARVAFVSKAIQVAAILLLAACSGQTAEQPASQVIARVNEVEITVLQYNQALQTMGVQQASEQLQNDTTSKLIDREIAVQAATEAGMDKYPEVLLQIEEARRDILASAFAQSVAARAKPPTAQEAERFTATNPALFSGRRIYRLREAAFASDIERLDEVRRLLSESASLSDISQWSHAQAIPFNEQIAIRSAEQLPLEALPGFQKAKIGDTLIFESPQGLLVYEVLDAQPAPVAPESARAIALNHLTRERGRREVESTISTLRSMTVISYATGLSAQQTADVEVADAATRPQ